MFVIVITGICGKDMYGFKKLIKIFRTFEIIYYSLIIYLCTLGSDISTEVEMFCNRFTHDFTKISR